MGVGVYRWRWSRWTFRFLSGLSVREFLFGCREKLTGNMSPNPVSSSDWDMVEVDEFKEDAEGERIERGSSQESG